MKTAYFDTSIISRWYVLESSSVEALAARARFRPPVPLTPVHRLELTAAWHAKVHRKEVPLEAIRAALDDLEADVASGVVVTPRLDLATAFGHAERLARRHGATIGARSLDVLHVALALEIGEAAFVTADRRQASLAAACGLRVNDLSAP